MKMVEVKRLLDISKKENGLLIKYLINTLGNYIYLVNDNKGF